MKFTFSPESQPLDGYTIKRAIYRGGFGEVYQAVTTSGREVALKLIQNNAQVELRGIQHCLNLSHPNLVMIFNVLEDADHDHWIVMEYISGPTLDALLEEHPQGLPGNTAHTWLKGLAAGVEFLHSRGIVHRDLKPANLFLQNGVVKIGDVGLSKMIGPSQRSAQTQSVGTVYYMAPEVANGSYGKEVDIYACGVILYELLTGDVPFTGESTGEILLKHLTAQPDLTRLPQHLRPVLSKALQKSPQARYRTMAEFLQAFEQAIGINQPGRIQAGTNSPPLTPPLPPVLPTPFPTGASAHSTQAAKHQALQNAARDVELNLKKEKSGKRKNSCCSFPFRANKNHGRSENEAGSHCGPSSRKWMVALRVLSIIFIVFAFKLGAPLLKGDAHNFQDFQHDLNKFKMLAIALVIVGTVAMRLCFLETRSAAQKLFEAEKKAMTEKNRIRAEQALAYRKASTAAGMACLSGLLAAGLSFLAYYVVGIDKHFSLFQTDPSFTTPDFLWFLTCSTVIPAWGISALRYAQTVYADSKLSFTFRFFMGLAVGVCLVACLKILFSQTQTLLSDSISHLNWKLPLAWGFMFLILPFTTQTSAKRILKASLSDIFLNTLVGFVIAVLFLFSPSFAFIQMPIITCAIQLSAPWRGHIKRTGVLVSDLRR